jgi:DNA (cytosine-5)-methyltransferase 1
LDAKFFGLPQQRKRVFLVASATGGGLDPSKILFEVPNGSRDPDSNRKERKADSSSIQESIGSNLDCEVKIYENHRKDARYNEKTICPTVVAHYGTGGSNVPFVITNGLVRKLLPIECERLQGFPDDYTKIPWKGKEKEDCPDSHRYKAIGNSWAVPCVRWIGKRIQAELEKTK